MKKYLFLIFLTWALVFHSFSSLATPTDSLLIFMNDELVTFSNPPITSSNSIFIPFQESCNLLGLTYDFDLSTFSNDFSNYCVEKNVIFIDADEFSHFFELDIELNNHLLLKSLSGSKVLSFNGELFKIPIYTDKIIPSLLVNHPFEIDDSTSHTFLAFVDGIFFDKDTLYLASTPYTLISPPQPFSTVAPFGLFNSTQQTLTFPLSSDFLFEYAPSNFLWQTTSITSNQHLFYETALHGLTPYLELTVENHYITKATQLFYP